MTKEERLLNLLKKLLMASMFLKKHGRMSFLFCKKPIKIDISTDDIITPASIDYEYKLMFEDRTISLLTYNTETFLAEKIQTVLKRGIANTRMELNERI